MPNVYQYVRFEDHADNLPKIVEGPFAYVQCHHSIMEGERPDGEFVSEIAALNEDGTWNAGPENIQSCGYTDVVFWSQIDSPPNMTSPSEDVDR